MVEMTLKKGQAPEKVLSGSLRQKGIFFKGRLKLATVLWTGEILQKGRKRKHFWHENWLFVDVLISRQKPFIGAKQRSQTTRKSSSKKLGTPCSVELIQQEALTFHHEVK